jgi:Flp pilus assembly protein TadB
MSNEKSSSSSSSGIGFVGLLTIAFIVLKLCNVIDWSWWWVVSPIWISIALFVVIGIPLIILLMYLTDKKEKKREAKRLDEAMEASEAKRNSKLN